jgi:DNA topoisomerase-3
MSEFVVKEKYEGTWNGKRVRFSREWRGRRFTDEECEALCEGKTLEVRDLVSVKTGKPYGVKCHLADLVSSQGNAYVGVDIVEFLKRGVPQTFLQHDFTEDERIMLESGKAVQVDDFVSNKTGKTFSCKVTYDPDQDRLVFER